MNKSFLSQYDLFYEEADNFINDLNYIEKDFMDFQEQIENITDENKNCLYLTGFILNDTNNSMLYYLRNCTNKIYEYGPTLNNYNGVFFTILLLILSMFFFISCSYILCLTKKDNQNTDEKNINYLKFNNDSLIFEENIV